jgi:hypothetical protein
MMPYPEDVLNEVPIPANHIRIARALVGLDPNADPGSPLREPTFAETQLAAYRVWELIGKPMDNDTETVTIWLSAQEVLRYLPEPYPLPTEG